MKWDKAYSEQFLSSIRIPKNNVVLLHAGEHGCPFFCADIAMDTLRNSIEELQAIFEYEPRALKSHISTINGEGQQLAALFLDIKTKEII